MVRLARGEEPASGLARMIVHLVFGLPMALVAYVVLRSTRWLQRRLAIRVGALAGCVAVGWTREPRLGGWCAGMGALTGALCWRVAYGAVRSAAR